MSKMITVSKWQGCVDWKRVKEYGIETAYIAIGSSFPEGGISKDPRFLYNMQQASEQGIQTGVYLHAYDSSCFAVQKSVQELLCLTIGYSIQLPICYKMNEDYYRNFNKKCIRKIQSTFFESIKEQNKRGIVWASEKMLAKTKQDNSSALSWVVPKKNTNVQKYDAFQLQEKGYIGGRDSNVAIHKLQIEHKGTGEHKGTVLLC